MRKFSEINEEFLGFGKKSDKFTETTTSLMEMYSKNLISEEFLKLKPHEKDYNFTYYKITSITKLGVRKFRVGMTTYGSDHEKVEDVMYLLELKTSLAFHTRL